MTPTLKTGKKMRTFNKEVSFWFLVSRAFLKIDENLDFLVDFLEVSDKISLAPRHLSSAG